MSAAPKIKFTLKTNRPGEEASSPSANPVPESLTPAQESARQRERLEGKLLGAIDCLWQMELKAGDVTEKNVDFLARDMDKLVKHYAGISTLSSEMKETVQYAALQQVDQESLNPHRWTRELVSTALRANQLGNARVKAYESYHDTLVDAMREAFPDMQDVLIPLKDSKEAKVDTKMQGSEFAGPAPL